MKEYTCLWFLKFRAYADEPALLMGLGEGENKRYSNLQVWMKINLAPNSYFFLGNTSIPDETYFAIASMSVVDVVKDGWDTSPIAVSPGGGSSALGIYYTLFGNAAENPEGSITQYQYNHAVLNPAYFRPEVYTKVTLDNFGTQSYYEGFLYKWKGDVVMMSIQVRLFVVGEWSVQDIQDPDDQTPPDVIGSAQIWLEKALAGFGAWLQTPEGWIFMLAGFMLIVLVVLAFSGALPVLLAVILGRQSRGGR
jgi:hypothetical protein